uniref:Small ribosomal subunit protein mS40 n=1 Tax=Anopheles christyi TaxID=43041 RepID=A0A182JR63_9DIPT
MSVLRLIGGEIISIYRQSLLTIGTSQARGFSATGLLRHAAKPENEAAEEAAAGEDSEQAETETNAAPKPSVDDPKDRTRVIPVETSIRYLASEAYRQTYQEDPVWKQYRRNHKGPYPPKLTRKTCIRKGRISTGNPCPICRDEYLVLDHNNIDLLKQFISPQTGEVLSYRVTGLCQKKHTQLLVAVERAMDRGMLTFDVPFREYDYSEYYPAKEDKSSSNMAENLSYTYVIVGGGIAGVTCAETLTLLRPIDSTDRILLLTESTLVKAVTNVVPLGKILNRFDVEEKSTGELAAANNIDVLLDQLDTIVSEDHLVRTTAGKCISYRYLCLCTGARPNIIDKAKGNANVIGIRDTESVEEFRKRIHTATRLVVVGNGGIASELVYEMDGMEEVHWVIKDPYISSTFVDSGAANFFRERLNNKGSADKKKTIYKRMRYTEQKDGEETTPTGVTKRGAALGPDWHRAFDIQKHGVVGAPNANKVTVHHSVEVENIKEAPSGLQVLLTDGSTVDCDFVVSATGVVPAISWNGGCDRSFKLGPDGGLCVNWLMETSVDGIYAAGDVCYAAWELAPHWFQMRLWTQARQMGAMAARSMAAKRAGEEIYQDFCFEMFNHVTTLFGYQVVLLGRYNGQGLNDKYEVLLRMTPGLEYIKFVLVDGRLQGALLVGETGLEETCENLILNQLDLSPYGEDLLNPDIDIEDYFD